MKKAAAILLAGVMAFGLIGCGGTQTSGSGKRTGGRKQHAGAECGCGGGRRRTPVYCWFRCGIPALWL